MPSEGYIATRRFTGETTAGPFSGPNVDYIDKATDIEVEKLASGAEANAGVILNVGAGATEYTIDSSGSLPTVTLGTALVAGDVLQVRRKTTRGSREVDFVQGATLTEADLDKATKQGIYLGEEALDRSKDSNDLYNDMASSYETATLPVPGTATNMMVSDGSEWAVKSKVDCRDSLELGTAALYNVGTTPTHLVLQENFGSAAFLGHGGTLAGQYTTHANLVPINSLLGSSVYVNTGTIEGRIPVLVADGALPAVSGANLTNLKQPPRVTFRHAHLQDSSDSGYSTKGFSTTLAVDTWHIRPLNERIVHSINGVTDDFDAELTGASGAGANSNGIANEILLGQAGTYSIEFVCNFSIANEVATRLVDITDEESHVLVSEGTTIVAKTSYEMGTSIGKTIYVASAPDKKLQIHYAISQAVNTGSSGNHSFFGAAMEGTIDGAYITNVFAFIIIEKVL